MSLQFNYVQHEKVLQFVFLVLVVGKMVNNLSLLLFLMLVLILHISIVLFYSRTVKEGTSFIVQKMMKPVHSLCVYVMLDWVGLFFLAVGISFL